MFVAAVSIKISNNCGCNFSSYCRCALQVDQLHQHPHQVVLIIVIIVSCIVRVVAPFVDDILLRLSHHNLAASVEILFEVVIRVVVNLVRALVISRVFTLR